MELPLIEALDLRPPQPANVDDGWDWVGDFTPFPARLQHFIDHGRMPSRWSRKIEVTIRADMTEFNASMERIKLALSAKPRIPVTIIDHLHPQPYRRRHWHLGTDGWIIVAAVFAAIVIGLIVGTYPWR